jgi:hypothetical protein
MTKTNDRPARCGQFLLSVSAAIAVGGMIAFAPVPASAEEPPAPAAATPPSSAPGAPEGPSGPPAAGEVVPATPATMTPPPGPPAPAVAASPPPAAAPPASAPWGPDPKNVAVGAWLRLGGRIQNPSSRNSLNDVWMDEIYLILTANGRITPWFKWQFNLNANNPPTQPNGVAPLSYASVGIQDLIVKLELDPLFNIWVGRMLVPADRSNLSGPWFINYFLYPGFLRVRSAPPPIGIKSGANGRDNGVTAWGQVAGGAFKYYLGAYNLDAQSHDVNPLLTARVVLNLLDPEPGFYHQSSYHGAKDVAAIGASLQYQKSGAFKVLAPGTPPTIDVGDYRLLEVDALLDKKMGDAGVGTLESATYFYDERQPVRQFYMFCAGYVLPQPIGPGRFAPAVRYQFTETPNVKMIDGYLQYLIQSHFAKFFAGYYWADMGPMGGKQKAFQFGIQIIRL